MTLSLLLILFSSARAFAEDPSTSLKTSLTVAVAANVQYTFEELKAVFEKETGITIKTVIGSSG